MLPRQDQPPLGVGESASVPSAAAIANAIFDATGVRFRELPFTPERILAGLRGEQGTASTPQPLAAPKPPAPTDRWKNPFVGRRGALATAAALCVAVVGVGAAVLPWRSIAPIARPDASTWSEATIARGRQLAALGDCAVCHTVANGVINAGGRAIETPFGTIYATNITPDVETGIGAWSYPAFERAMREGIHRDGRHLYPAFPYTHFAKTSDADLQALYAYLMAQPAVRARNSEKRTGLSVQLASAAGGMERAVSSAQPPSRPTRPNRRYGIAAPIWSRASAIAAPAIRRAMRWGRRRPAPISPAASRKAGRRRRSPRCRRRRSPGARMSFSHICEPANPACTASPPGRWRRW